MYHQTSDTFSIIRRRWRHRMSLIVFAMAGEGHTTTSIAGLWLRVTCNPFIIFMHSDKSLISIEKRTHLDFFLCVVATVEQRFSLQGQTQSIKTTRTHINYSLEFFRRIFRMGFFLLLYITFYFFNNIF